MAHWRLPRGSGRRWGGLRLPHRTHARRAESRLSVGVAQPLHLHLSSGFRSAAPFPCEPICLSPGGAGREAPRRLWHWALDSQVWVSPARASPAPLSEGCS